MKLGDVYVTGIGASVPDTRVDTREAADRGWYDPERQRTSGQLTVAVAGDVPAPELAIDAAHRALKTAGPGADRVGMLIHSHIHDQGPEGWPVQHYINLRTVGRSMPSLLVNNGCLGMLSGLTLASTWLRSRPEGETVLLTAADNLGTAVVDRWRTSYLYVLADAGVSLVLGREPGIARILSIGSASDPEAEIVHRGDQPLFPPGGTLNFDERLDQVREKWISGELEPVGDIGSVVVDACDQALADAGRTWDDVARVTHVGFAHQPLHDLYLDPIGIDDDRGTWDFTRTVGHAGPADPVLGLDHLIATGAVGPGDVVALVGGAPGMEACCVLVEITAP